MKEKERLNPDVLYTILNKCDIKDGWCRYIMQYLHSNVYECDHLKRCNKFSEVLELLRGRGGGHTWWSKKTEDICTPTNTPPTYQQDDCMVDEDSAAVLNKEYDNVEANEENNAVQENNAVHIPPQLKEGVKEMKDVVDTLFGTGACMNVCLFMN